MATIVPTVETVGDEALTNSIIDRSITELQDNVLTSFGNFGYGLAFATNLKKVVFGALQELHSRDLGSCEALETADFYQLSSLNGDAFSGSTALAALIIRTPEMCTLSSSGLWSSGVANGTGYIYVPAALVDSYKANSNWSTYADQIRAIEDYPEICDPHSWEAVAKHIEAGTYATAYAVGDTVPLDLGDEGVINMQIAAFDTDDLADGSGKAAISWVAKELLASGTTLSAVTAWGEQELRTYLNETLWGTIPSNVASIIKSVTKTSYSYNGSTRYEESTEEKVWIPGIEEVVGWLKTQVYRELFTSSTSRVKCKKGSSDASDWWLRDAANSSKYNRIITAIGEISSYSYTVNNCICIGFCT